MKRVLSLLFAFTFGVLGFAMQGAHSQTPSHGSAEKFRRVEKPVPNSYIVVLKDAAPGVDTAAVAAELAGRHGGNVKHVYQHALKGFAVELPAAAAEALSRNP